VTQPRLLDGLANQGAVARDRDLEGEAARVGEGLVGAATHLQQFRRREDHEQRARQRHDQADRGDVEQREAGLAGQHLVLAVDHQVVLVPISVMVPPRIEA